MWTLQTVKLKTKLFTGNKSLIFQSRFKENFFNIKHQQKKIKENITHDTFFQISFNLADYQSSNFEN